MLPEVCMLGTSFTQRLLSAEVTRSRKRSVEKRKNIFHQEKEWTRHRESLSSVLGKLFELRVSMRLIKSTMTGITYKNKHFHLTWLLKFFPHRGLKDIRNLSSHTSSGKHLLIAAFLLGTFRGLSPRINVFFRFVGNKVTVCANYVMSV